MMGEENLRQPCMVVSIHDVSPATVETTSVMIEDLARVGVSVTSLLVIPNHHGVHPVVERPDFQRQIQAWARDGHEVVLHGYFHRRPPKQCERLLDKVVTRLYTAGEGEFYDLSYAEARTQLQRGLNDFAACGFENVRGFIAPAWLLGADAERAVMDSGFQYTTLLGGIKRLRPAAHYRPSQSLVYSVRAPWRVACSLVWNALLARHLRSNPVVRLSLHPPDWSHPGVRRQALRIASQCAAVRHVATYAQICA